MCHSPHVASHFPRVSLEGKWVCRKVWGLTGCLVARQQWDLWSGNDNVPLGSSGIFVRSCDFVVMSRGKLFGVKRSYFPKERSLLLFSPFSLSLSLHSTVDAFQKVGLELSQYGLTAQLTHGCTALGISFKWFRIFLRFQKF